MITFHAIRFKNFLSSGDSFSVINLTRSPLTLIRGRNGAGKSTLIDAICFALYGKPFRKINKPQLVNSVNKKNCVVELGFSIGSNKYTVRRGIKPNLFEIYKNKELLPEDPSVGDYQKQLDSILEMTYKTFCQVNIIGKASYVPFMSLTAASRREVVEDLLDSQVYGVMLGLAKTEQTEINRRIKDLDADKRVVEAKIEAQEKLIARSNADKSTQIQEKKNSLTEIVEERAKYVDASVKGKIAKQKALEEYNLVKDDQLAVDIVEVKSQILSLTNEIRSSSALWMTIEHMKHCPQCAQEVESSHKDFIYRKTDEKTQGLKIKKLEYEGKLPELLHKQKLSNEKAEKFNDITVKLSGVTTKISMLDQQIARLQKELEILQVVAPEVNIDQEELEDLRNNLIITETKYNDAVKELGVIKKTIALLGDDGIKASLIKKYIPIINKYINEYLEKMDLFVQFELDEQFNETIKSRYRDIFSYDSFSEGEKARIDIAILLTWRKIARVRNSTSTNIIVFDETMDGSMDSTGSDDFLKLLQISDAQNTFIISHNQTVIDGFDDVIVAEKVGNFTEYTIQGSDD